MRFNQKSSYFLDSFDDQARCLSKLRSGNTGPFLLAPLSVCCSVAVFNRTVVNVMKQ